MKGMMMSRRIDALVAEHVFGYELIESGKDGEHPHYHSTTDQGLMTATEVPHYSSNEDLAETVRTKMKDFGVAAPIITSHSPIKGPAQKQYFVKFIVPNEAGEEIAYTETSTSLPMAICIAALKANGVEV